MKVAIIAVLALVALTSASVLPPVLVPKVAVAAPQVTVVKQPYVVQEPVPAYRTVPVPIKTVAYTAPIVETPVVHQPYPVIAPVPYHVPVAAPAPLVYHH
ncbi:hypothetical protein LSTR_LSTR006026 [Laodelphax striatellus]|uniref:Uncharacterized protein n=1 Tax=Laodelphax striatellus TaxID=195883 RepID=A0A482XPG4_LAOST|nr:hypothetical protein LSTR_LSTR006026 [Laodelphax striatellus]